MSDFKPKNIEICRVSEQKLRMKYELPILFVEGKEITVLGYQKIGITLRDYYSDFKNAKKRYTCFRPFEKYLNKISGIYGIKKKFLTLETLTMTQIFEEIEADFEVPKALIFKGEGVKEAVRKWKIKKLINSSSEPSEISEA